MTFPNIPAFPAWIDNMWGQMTWQTLCGGESHPLNMALVVLKTSKTALPLG